MRSSGRRVGRLVLKRMVDRRWLCRDLETPVSALFEENLRRIQGGKGVGAESGGSAKEREDRAAAATGPARPTSRSMHRLSLSGKEATGSGDSSTGARDKAFPFESVPLSAEAVGPAWEEMVGSFRKHAPQYISFIGVYTPVLSDDGSLELRVKTELERDQIAKIVFKIDSFLALKFPAERPSLRVVVDSSAFAKKDASAMTNDEFVARIRSANPAVDDLLRFLGVEEK